MGTKLYSFLLVLLTFMTTDLLGQAPAITGPVSVCEGTAAVAYTAPAGMAAYNWTLSGGGTITAGALPETITVNWTTAGTWTLSVSDGAVAPTVLTLLVTVNPLPVPTITGPVDAGGMPAALVKGANLGQVYTTEPLMTGYTWAVPAEGLIVAGAGTESITVDWTNVKSKQSVSVTYIDANGCAAAAPTVLGINYFPFAGPIDPASILQFQDPVPHFAAGLRVNAKTGGNLVIRTQTVQQVALSTGTVLANGTIGVDPGAGVGNYAAYQISKDNGVTWGPAMWPAQTIEAQQGFPLTVEYQNGLPTALTYDHFNILADQTLMMKGYTPSGNRLTTPYNGEIPMVVHLHGGEIPSNSDGGPNSWIMPSGLKGPAFKYNASTLVSYPNQQEAATLWYHPHDDGLTRINVYTGLAGYYFLRGQDEETAQLPGWSGDDLVREVTPAGKAPTFNGANAYLPEIELAVQDRMFDVNGQLYWPVAPPNPEIHPFWTPEFVGDIMTVNGKSWPYLSVAPRKYRFRFLDGCNARWLNMWLVNAADGVTPGPKITMIGGEGGLLEVPVDLDPAMFKTLLIGPGQRADVIIDFTGIPAGTTFTLMNDAGAPYPFGDPVVPGLSDRIMQFVVNGELVSALDPALPGTDKGLIPVALRPVNPLVKLTDFAGNVAPGVTPVKTRQLILNEVMSVGGPASVMVNNSYFDAELSFATDTNYRVGGPTEFLEEGTTEIIQIANVSADAHPIHIHLTQWQIVSRQAIDDIGYLDAYAAAWAPRGIAPFPVGMAYPGGGGTPLPYETVNADGAIGGNPAFSTFLVGPPMPPNPEEMGWKDNVTVLPGQVTTFIVRIAPTDKPVGATPAQLLYPFDPSQGPGYVWHCHIIDHEDMSMMRPLMIQASPLRWPLITAQPAPVIACIGDAVTFNVTATSMSAMTYQWQVSADGGATWANVVDGAPYAGALTASLGISPTALAMTGSLYKCILTNNVGTKETAPVLLTVNTCSVTGTLVYNNAALEPLAGFTVGLNGQTAITDALGAFTFASVSSGIHPVTVTAPATPLPGSINSTDAGAVNGWALMPLPVPMVKFLAGDVDNSTLLNATDALAIQNNFVSALPFVRTPWVFHDAAAVPVTTNPPALTVNVAGTSATLNILGMFTGDFNSSFSPTFVAPGVPKVILTNNLTPISVARNTSFDLPIVSTTPLQVGAFSLVLNLNSALVTVQSVKVPGSKILPTFKVVGNELRIGWNSTVPDIVPAAGPLVVLTLMPTPAFIDPNVLTVTLVPSELNEIADGLFNPLLVAPNLTVDNVTIAGVAKINTLKLTVFPNPATTTVTIGYELPKAGAVTLGLYLANGTPASPVYLNGAATPAGVYSYTADVTALLPGTYYVKLTFVETLTLKTTTKTVKLIKQ